MREILSTTDPVLLSFASSLLADAGIRATVADQYTSSIEGSVGVLPRRLLVHPDAWADARRALSEGGLAGEIARDDDADGLGEDRV